MRCRICNQDRAGDTIITIVNDPPIDICPKCSGTSSLLEEWITISRGDLAIVDLVEDRFDFDTLKMSYKPAVVSTISNKNYRVGAESGLAFKCAKCSQIYPTSRVAFKHVKTHTTDPLFRYEEEAP